MNDFWDSFLANFLADLSVLLLISLLVKPFYKNIIKAKPKLKFIIKQGPFYSGVVKLQKKENGDHEAIFRFAIKNLGEATFKPNEGYWHVYFPDADMVESIKGANGFESAMEPTHHRNIIDLPIHSGSVLDIGPEYRYIFKKESQGEKELKPKSIYYWFETDYGNFPSSAKVNSKDGSVNYKDMGIINFEI